MNTEQLQCAIQCDTYMKSCVIGVFSVDHIPSHIAPGMGVIVNTDPANLPGRHWIAFYLNQQNELECFDSFGNSPAVYSMYLRQFMNRFSKTIINRRHLQSGNTNVCGQYCLLYLICRCRGRSVYYFNHLFENQTNINDEFVFNVIDKNFQCCLYDCNHGQCSVSKNKIL